MTTNSPHAGAPPARSRATRDMAARIWRSRISRIASIWLVVAAIEYLAWRFFLRSPFYRELFAPIAVVVAIIGLATTWRTLSRRAADRRNGDRRHVDRREESAGSP